MTKILTLDTEYDFGSLTFPIPYYNEFDDIFSAIRTLQFENNISEVFFIDLLKITTDAIYNIQDNERGCAKFIDYIGYHISIKLLYRDISIQFSFNTEQSKTIVSKVLIPYNIKKFSEYLLEDYKKLTETGELKSFLNEDRAYMKLLNDYYIKLQKAYDDTF